MLRLNFLTHEFIVLILTRDQDGCSHPEGVTLTENDQIVAVSLDNDVHVSLD